MKDNHFEEADLLALIEQIEPRHDFAATLEKQLRQAHPAARAARWQVTLFWRIALTGAAAALVVLVVGLSPLPAVAQEWWNSLFQRTDDQQQFATPILIDPVPTPTYVVTPPVMSVAEIEATVGYDIREPRWLPDGYTLLDASVSDRDGQGVSLTYLRNGAGLTLLQQPAALAQPWEIGNSARVIQVQIGSLTGEYVEGHWTPVLSQTDSGAAIEGQVWNADFPLQQLRWSDGAMVYTLINMIPQRSDLPLVDWIKIAESVQ